MVQNQKNTYFRLQENLLFYLLFGCEFLLLWKTWNHGAGFDWPRHLDMLELVSWSHPNTNIHTVFYGYHPPLLFLLARSLWLTGIPKVASVQLLNVMAAFMSFLGLRQTLRFLNLLHTTSGIVFLYLTAAIPLSVFLSHSVNMDAWVLMLGSWVLYFSVKVFFAEKMPGRTQNFLNVILTTVLCATGMMVKFNALLIFAIPMIVALVSLGAKKWWLRVGIAAAACLCAIALVFPYYYARYYIPEHTFFPSNTDTFDAGAQANARRQRDADRTGFILEIFLDAKAHAQGPEFRDMERLRIFDTWKDIWIQDRWLGQSNDAVRFLSVMYLKIASVCVVLGLLGFLSQVHRWRTWDKLGAFFVSYGLLLIFFMVLYIYRNPWAGSLSNKAIYIPWITWPVGYCLATLVQESGKTPSRKTMIYRNALFIAIAIVIICNYALPVY